MVERPLIVGLGNEMRGDDAAGLWVADLLRHRGHDAVRCEREPIDLLELTAGRSTVVCVDAVAGDRPGRIWRLDGRDDELPLIFASRASTHLLGLSEALELGRSLDLLPPALRVIGIEGERFALGSRPSPAVEAAIGEVVAALASEIELSGAASGVAPTTATAAS